MRTRASSTEKPKTVLPVSVPLRPVSPMPVEAKSTATVPLVPAWWKPLTHVRVEKLFPESAQTAVTNRQSDWFETAEVQP